MSIRWSDRSASSDWSSAKVNYSALVRSDFIKSLTVTFRVLIKTLNVESDVERVVSDVIN